MTARVHRFSEDRLYRYTLWREWHLGALISHAPRGHEYLMVIGLNPSTADETKDDPTLRKCIGFAQRWGFGALCMTNLFAFRATDPKVMKAQPEPIGAENDSQLQLIADGAGMILCAWGKHGAHLGRDRHVAGLLGDRKLSALKLNKDMSPMHPLYVPYETAPERRPHPEAQTLGKI